jgi:hypothetical protein
MAQWSDRQANQVLRSNSTTLEPENNTTRVVTVSRTFRQVPKIASLVTSGGSDRYIAAVRTSLAEEGSSHASRQPWAAADLEYEKAVGMKADALRQSHVEAWRIVWDSRVELQGEDGER